MGKKTRSGYSKSPAILVVAELLMKAMWLLVIIL